MQDQSLITIYRPKKNKLLNRPAFKVHRKVPTNIFCGQDSIDMNLPSVFRYDSSSCIEKSQANDLNQKFQWNKTIKTSNYVFPTVYFKQRPQMRTLMEEKSLEQKAVQRIYTDILKNQQNQKFQAIQQERQRRISSDRALLEESYFSGQFEHDTLLHQMGNKILRAGIRSEHVTPTKPRLESRFGRNMSTLDGIDQGQYLTSFDQNRSMIDFNKGNESQLMEKKTKYDALDGRFQEDKIRGKGGLQAMEMDNLSQILRQRQKNRDYRRQLDEQVKKEEERTSSIKKIQR